MNNKMRQLNQLIGLICLLYMHLPLFAQFNNIKLDEADGLSYPPCEPSIAINPLNTDNIVAGAILDKVYVTFDGGTSWEKQRLSSTYGVYGDPCIVADMKGNFYYLHLSDPNNKGWSSPQLLDRIVCQRSSDGGRTWDNGTFMGNYHPKDQDKEWAIADPSSKYVYASWTQFDRYESKAPEDKSNILFAYSKNRGKSWKKAIRINEISGDCLDGDQTAEGAVPAVGPNGEVYVAWAINEKIYVDKSVNKGKSWLEKDILVADQPGGWEFSIPGIHRCNGMPILLCDLSEGPHKGTLYVNWSDQRNGENDTDIWLAKSTDGGDSWSAPIRVNDDGKGKHQFFTWMTIDQTTGYLYTVFYDRRNYDDSQTDVYIAYSTDGGNSFTNLPISETPFIPGNNAFFGDYNHISAHNGRVCPIWTRMDQLRTSVWTAVISHDDLTFTP